MNYLFKLLLIIIKQQSKDIQILKNYDIQFNLQYRTKGRTYDHEKEWRFYQKKENFSNGTKKIQPQLERCIKHI